MIIPTILEQDLTEITNKINLLKNDAVLIQLDVVENGFVDGETYFDIDYLDNFESYCDFEIDLMVFDPQRFVEKKYEKVKKVCSHIKGNYIDQFLDKCNKNEYLSGISIGPHDEVKELLPYIETVDYVEFITVEPGGQGRGFDPNSIEKIKTFRFSFPDIPIQVDGGVNETSMRDLLNLGIKDLVIGSAIFKAENPLDQFKKFQKELRDYA